MQRLRAQNSLFEQILTRKEKAMNSEKQEQTKTAWNKLAVGFDEFVTPIAMPLAEDALRRVGLRPGMRFLDVAAGSGALSIPAARLGAEVLATDISPTMIERLTARAYEAGLTNLEGRVMNGQDLDLQDDAFDVTGSQNGVSIFPDLRRGLSELVRVTRPGGRALIIAFGPLPKTEFITFFLEAMQAAVPGFNGLPSNGPPLPFQVADPEKLRQELTDAGLKDVEIETATWKMEFQSAAHLWGMMTNSNPIGAMLVANLTEEQQAAVRQILDGMLRERAAGNGAAVLTSPVNIAVGTK
jgi:ubiquinone/menaquinone biosynthesis C-methylase UbiE